MSNRSTPRCGTKREIGGERKRSYRNDNNLLIDRYDIAIFCMLVISCPLSVLCGNGDWSNVLCFV